MKLSKITIYIFLPLILTSISAFKGDTNKYENMAQKKMIIYQVFTRLFGNENATNKANGNIEENGVGKFSDFTTEALNSIKSIGITHVWFTGVIEHASKTDYSSFGLKKDHPAIVKGNAGSPYAIKDYYDVDPDLADNVPDRMKEFEALIDRTHKAGLKVIIDFVPNHVARQYHSVSKPKGVVDLGEKDDINTTFSPNNNFYYMPGQSLELVDFEYIDENGYVENPAKVTGNDCFTATPKVTDWYETIKLNYGVDYLNGRSKHFDPIPDTWNKMKDILLFWAAKNVDGFRCDMAEMVPVEFWAWAIPQIKSQYPSIDFIAEIYNPQEYRNYIFTGNFDYLYDKVGLYDTIRSVISGNTSAKAITHCWQPLEGIQDKMLNFMENHDEQRIASDFFAGNPWKGVPGMIVSATMNINPVMIYFGQELGEPGMDNEGYSGRDGRTTIFDYWSVESIRNWKNKGKFDTRLLSDDQKNLREFYTKLLKLCNTEKAVYKGIFFDLMYANIDSPDFNAEKQYTFLRQSDNEVLLIVVNFDDHDSEIAINIPFHAFEYMQINPKQKISGTDLLSGEIISSILTSETPIHLKIKANSGRIIKYQVKP